MLVDQNGWWRKQPKYEFGDRQNFLFLQHKMRANSKFQNSGVVKLHTYIQAPADMLLIQFRKAECNSSLKITQMALAALENKLTQIERNPDDFECTLAEFDNN